MRRDSSTGTDHAGKPACRGPDPATTIDRWAALAETAFVLRTPTDDERVVSEARAMPGVTRHLPHAAPIISSAPPPAFRDIPSVARSPDTIPQWGKFKEELVHRSQGNAAVLA
ncbi:hypothetical protein B5P19_15220 [Clavibacter sepedonicus]|uniref:Uncharacterized protein n=1 Tax=Clavibacter sepedonicus TaxID=31964 RepID=B0RJ76_CLASE|nr:hypothetical protein B5P19_15220 [Clavibacter sepedonicus]OQJ50851.1 hypothetical protein B5P20_15555 [Clavibacter sepedonicus]CAQ03266.1 hypothetical protein pCSL0021 [Clavibacter sepedonicus]